MQPETAVRLTGDHRVRRFRGAETFDDGARRFTVALLGAGSMDWSYEASAGELRIERVRATDASSEVVVFRHRGADFGVGDSRLERPVGAFRSNALFGQIALRGQRGRFRFADGELEVDVRFAVPTNVHFDGGTGAFDAVPVDGSLVLDACTERCRRESGAVVLVARPSGETARVEWRQVRGPRVALRDAKSARASVTATAECDGAQAAFVVGADRGRAVAIETVIVRLPRA